MGKKKKGKRKETKPKNIDHLVLGCHNDFYIQSIHNEARLCTALYFIDLGLVFPSVVCLPLCMYVFMFYILILNLWSNVVGHLLIAHRQ